MLSWNTGVCFELFHAVMLVTCGEFSCCNFCSQSHCFTYMRTCFEFVNTTVKLLVDLWTRMHLVCLHAVFQLWVVVYRRLPVLLQGETSVGKTSLITYLARITGNKCHRINNHEHTDIQEYLGCYTASERSGRLVFSYGVFWWSVAVDFIVLFCIVWYCEGVKLS